MVSNPQISLSFCTTLASHVSVGHFKATSRQVVTSVLDPVGQIMEASVMRRERIRDVKKLLCHALSVFFPLLMH
jgi:regulator of sigma D